MREEDKDNKRSPMREPERRRVARGADTPILLG